MNWPSRVEMSSSKKLFSETSAKCRERLERGRLVRVMLGFELAGEPPALLLQRSLFMKTPRHSTFARRHTGQARRCRPFKTGETTFRPGPDQQGRLRQEGEGNHGFIMKQTNAIFDKLFLAAAIFAASGQMFHTSGQVEGWAGGSFIVAELSG